MSAVWRLGWALLVCCAVAHKVNAQTTDSDATSPADVAQAYVSAVEAMDWSTMASLLDDSAVFTDPTAATFGEDWRFEGPEAIVGFYRKGAEESETLSTRYDYQRVFTSGEYTVFDIVVTVRVKATMIGFPEEILEDTMDLVTVIRVTNGKVLSHTDYVDYATMMSRLEQHQRRLEAAQ